MSSLLSPSVGSTRAVACHQCRTPFDVPADSFVLLPVCDDCLRSHAWAEARKLLADAVALRDGTGVFACLSAAERQEQLVQLVGCGADGLADVLGMPVEPVLRFVPSDEPVYVKPADADPDPVTRQEIELRDDIEARIQVVEAEQRWDAERFDGLS